MAMVSSPVDILMRQAALLELEARASDGVLSSQDLARGFTYEGQRIPFVNPQRGIFRPRQMQQLLSIRTVFPKPGNRIWYDDQSQAHRQIFEAGELVDYSFMRGGADKSENRWLREAMEDQVPLIYFLGVSPGQYTSNYPTFVAEWSAQRQAVRLAFALPDASAAPAPPNAPERKYALSLVRRRLHQAAFREAVLTAYDGRCAISRLPEPRLLDAAHIVPDGDADLGQPIVPNGLLMSKVHHAAYDAHLIGIDPDGRVYVSEKLLSMNDGPVLESLKSAAGQSLLPPKRSQDRPDRDRLAARFSLFKAAA